MKLSVNIIGAGRLGKTIGFLLVKHNLVKINGICNSSHESTFDAINFIGDGQSYTKINSLPPADITFITTPDDLIPDACAQLNNNPLLKAKSIIMHCSGSLTSDVLSYENEKQCYKASIHPMNSFADPFVSSKNFAGTYCAIEGDKPAIDIIKPLFNAIGAITYTINKNKKTLYHLAGVFASNYLITLAKQAMDCLQSSGIEAPLSSQIVINIMRSTLINLEKSKSPIDALTGPLKRNDLKTIEKHLNAIDNNTQKNLYLSLGKATLSMLALKDADTELNKLLSELVN